MVKMLSVVTHILPGGLHLPRVFTTCRGSTPRCAADGIHCITILISVNFDGFQFAWPSMPLTMSRRSDYLTAPNAS
ncbi:hypothetical protein EDL96_07445 [Kocuria soli]|uniref:Uncharacterized protein n=1 Tax=Kocuria soli TaxID=2485125 RepID=A0A3N3ZXJ6_9MICC|nr:hypothetical protein EDL96_07445 [Kocuria soli]